MEDGGGDLQDVILCSLDVSRGHRNHQLLLTVDAYIWIGPTHSQSWEGGANDAPPIASGLQASNRFWKGGNHGLLLYDHC